LLKAKQIGLDDTEVIGVYIFYNLVYALCAFPLGILADKIGLKRIFVFGLCLFSLVYFGMIFCTNIYAVAGLFFLYGIYGAATEGVSKAWISNISDKQDTATAIGTYTGFQSICAMLASAMAGLIWFKYGSNASFWISGSATVLIMLYFMLLIKTVSPKAEK
jgi:MFS family permease